MLVVDPQSIQEPHRFEIRTAQVEDLALPRKVVEGPQRFIQRRLRIRSVRLIKIDVISLQAAQTPLDRIKDMLAREPSVVGSAPHWNPALGREDNLVAPSLQPFTHN